MRYPFRSRENAQEGTQNQYSSFLFVASADNLCKQFESISRPRSGFKLFDIDRFFENILKATVMKTTRMHRVISMTLLCAKLFI